MLTDTPATWHQRLATVVHSAGGRGVASHRSAARLHGFDGLESAGNAVIEVSVTRRFRLDPAAATVTHHVTPLDAVDVTSVAGIACTTRNRTLCDLGAVCDRRMVGRALTSARRSGIDLRAVRAAAERLHRPGQSGTGVIMRLLDGIPCEGRLPATWFEELLHLCLTDRALPPVLPQYPIRDGHGRIVARTDLGIPSVKLGLEAHSRRFHFGPDAERLDEDRDLAVAACGWELIYLGWYATRRPADVLRVVKEVIRARTHTLAAPGGEL